MFLQYPKIAKQLLHIIIKFLTFLFQILETLYIHSITLYNFKLSPVGI